MRNLQKSEWEKYIEEKGAGVRSRRELRGREREVEEAGEGKQVLLVEENKRRNRRKRCRGKKQEGAERKGKRYGKGGGGSRGR